MWGRARGDTQNIIARNHENLRFCGAGKIMEAEAPTVRVDATPPP